MLRGHRLEVWRLALLLDDKTLVSGAKDGTVCLWDTSLPHPHQPRITVSTSVINWCFSPDSRSLFTVDYGGIVSRWRGPDFQERESFQFNGADAVGIIFSPDGRFMAVGYSTGNLAVWDASRRVLRHEFKLGDGGVHPMSFLAQGNRLVVWFSADNRCSEWDLEANREIQSWPAPPSFYTLGLSPDERLSVVIGQHGDVSGRNLSEHNNTNLPLGVFEGLTVAFSPDGTRLAIASLLGYARVWDTAN